MPRLTVVDVGDGACSVLRCDCVSPTACACAVSVVDCGEWKATAARPARRLRAVLGPEGMRRLDTFVVTHFDADHWAGIRHIAPSLACTESDRLRLIYPRLPEPGSDTAAAALALLSLATGRGVRALELGDALAAVKQTELLPLREHDSFDTAGREWHVLWPPRQLPRSIRRGLENAIAALESLASGLDRDGHPQLREALQQAYDRPFPGGESAREAARDSAPVEEWDIGEYEPAETDDAHGALSDELVPNSWRDEFRRVARRVAAANNDLSLVFHDNSVCFFGDVQRSVVNHIVRSPLFPSGLHVVLAPHHGTAPVPPGFPHAPLCIAQAGRHHIANWQKHVDTHGQRRSCVNTARVGTLSWW